MKLEQARGWIHVQGSFTINQTSFGISPYSKLLGAIGVADEFKIYGDHFVALTEHILISDISFSQIETNGNFYDFNRRS